METVGYEVVGGVDFDSLTSVAHNKHMDDAFTVKNGKYYVSSGAMASLLNVSLAKDSARGTVLQFAPTNKFVYANLYNTFDHVLTAADVGKTYSIQFDMKTDSVGYIYYGLSSKAKRANDPADYSSPYNFSRNQFNIAAEDVGKWITYTYTVTITEKMLPTLVNGSTTEYAGVSLLGLYFRGFDGNIEAGSDRIYNPAPVVQIDNFKTYDISNSTTVTVPIEESVSISGVNDSVSSLIVKAPEAETQVNGIQKTYLMFAPGTVPANVQRAKLQFKVSAAAGQTMQVYALNADSLPENLNWNNAPVNLNETPVATLEAVAGKLYSIDVTDYVYNKANAKYIFVITCDDPSGCQYLNLNFDADIADLTGNVTVADGVATVTGAEGIRVEDIFGSNAVATAGETYTVSVKVKNTTASTVTYSLAPAYADGSKGTAVSESIAAGESKVLTLTFTATAQDVENELNAIAIYGGDCQIDDVSVSGAAPIVLPTDEFQLCLETAKTEPDADVISQIKLSGAAPTLQDNIAMNYKANKTKFDGLGITDPYLVVTFNGKETTIRDYTISADGSQYIFTFYNIAPNQMNDTLTAVLYATYDGEVYASAPRDYSVAQYCYTQLDKYSADAYAEFRTLLVDLLNYGAASQLYTGYNTGNLVNANLTETQKSWATAEKRTYNNVQTTKYETIDNPTVSWKGGGLVLNDSVTMRFKFATDNTEGLTFKVQSGGKTWTITEFTTEGDVNYIYFNGLHAGQMSQEVFITAYRNGAAVSNTVRYSIESYAAAKEADTETAYLAELVIAMMKYGDSAKAYIS